MTIVETALYREKYIYFGTVHFLWHAPDFLLGVPIPPLALPKTNGKPQDSDTRIPKYGPLPGTDSRGASRARASRR